MRIRWGPLAIATCGALGAALAASLGLWEPGWGVAAAFPLLVGALGAGVVRDPDGPEVHLFLGAAMAFTAGFLIVGVALGTSELDRLSTRASAGAEQIVADEVARMRESTRPKWVVIGSALPIGGAALLWRRRALRRSR
ncbi:hypothetical protein [Sandaracinus amylolyticus]|uniref:hypothetical protein n=1 Tax=Sandaracinus amylolyticus TaxID=927083 RepID=UPI001F2AC357|nr:hypothetical protein [Sandaracinus amylolyticus]UJR81611.1 Hypothetical protein I5071_36710 [Sandaracinus amylolyticus]